MLDTIREMITDSGICVGDGSFTWWVNFIDRLEQNRAYVCSAALLLNSLKTYGDGYSGQNGAIEVQDYWESDEYLHLISKIIQLDERFTLFKADYHSRNTYMLDGNSPFVEYVEQAHWVSFLKGKLDVEQNALRAQMDEVEYWYCVLLSYVCANLITGNQMISIMHEIIGRAVASQDTEQD